MIHFPKLEQKLRVVLYTEVSWTAGTQSPLRGHVSRADAVAHASSVQAAEPLAARAQVKLTPLPCPLPEGSLQVALKEAIGRPGGAAKRGSSSTSTSCCCKGQNWGWLIRGGVIYIEKYSIYEMALFIPPPPGASVAKPGSEPISPASLVSNNLQCVIFTHINPQQRVQLGETSTPR